MTPSPGESGSASKGAILLLGIRPPHQAHWRQALEDQGYQVRIPDAWPKPEQWSALLSQVDAVLVDEETAQAHLPAPRVLKAPVWPHYTPFIVLVSDPTTSPRSWLEMGYDHVTSMMDTEPHALHRDLQALLGLRRWAESILDQIPGLAAAMLGQSLVGVYLIGPDGRFRYVSTGLACIFDDSIPRLLGRPALDLVHPEDRALVATQIERRLQGQVLSVRYTFRGLRRDGQVIWCEVFGQRVTLGGQPTILGMLVDVSEREQALVARQHLLDYLEEILEQTQVVLWRMPLPERLDEPTYPPPTLPLLQVYGPLERLTGFTAAQFRNRPERWRERIHPEDRAQVEKGYQAALTTGREPVTVTYRWQRADGAWRWLQDRVHVERDPSGRPLALHGVVTDVTEAVHLRRRAELAARLEAILARRRPEEALERFLSTLGEAFPVDAGCVTWGDLTRQTTQILWVRPEARSGMQALAKALYGIPDLQDTFPVMPGSHHLPALTTGEPVYVADTAQGRYWGDSVRAEHGWRTTLVWPLETQEIPTILLILQSRTPHAFDDGELQAILAQLTPSLRAALMAWRHQEELTRLARRQAAILENLGDGVALLDPEGRIQQANQLAHTWLATLGRLDAAGRLTHLGPWSLADLQAGQAPREVVLEKPSYRILEVEARPVRENGQIAGWVLVLWDVTRQRETEAQLRRQERLAAVGQLAAGIAHDFNNALAAIILMGQSLAAQNDLPGRLRDRLGVILQQAGHAARLVNQILDFSRQAVYRTAPLELSAFIKEMGKLLRRTLPGHIDFRVEIQVPELWIQGDPTRLQQALLNLAVNARDAMPEGGRLTLSLARQAHAAPAEPGSSEPLPGPWAVLQVADTGTGIPTEVLPRIFEPFFTTKPPGQGTGLGLAQVHGIVHQHGGHIQVESQPGRGTVFRIYLPALEKPPLAPPAAETPQDISAAAGETILVVEDDPVPRAVLVEVLEGLGYRVLQATHGQEALSLYIEHADQIDLVLTDIIMPGMGGLALIQTLLALPQPPPILVYSGYPQDEETWAGLAAAAIEWVQKPASVETLGRAIRRLLARTSSNRGEPIDVMDGI